MNQKRSNLWCWLSTWDQPGIEPIRFPSLRRLYYLFTRYPLRSQLFMNDSSSLKPDEQNTTKSNPVVQDSRQSPFKLQWTKLLWWMHRVDELIEASLTILHLQAPLHVTLYQPEIPVPYKSMNRYSSIDILFYSASRSSKSSLRQQDRHGNAGFGRSAKGSNDSSLSSDDNSNFLTFTINIDWDEKTVKIEPKLGRIINSFLSAPRKNRKSKDRSHSRAYSNRGEKERRSSCPTNCYRRQRVRFRRCDDVWLYPLWVRVSWSF